MLAPLRQPQSDAFETAAAQAASPRDLVSLPEQDLVAAGCLLHAAGSVANADTYVVATAAGPVLLKTFRRRPWLMRVLFTRWTLRREFDALRALAGLPGIPTVYGLVGRDSLLMEYIAGGPLRNARELGPDEVPSARFLVRLRELVAAMHERGVSHGDVRRRNILRGTDDQPYLIDLATAVAARGSLPWLRRAVYGALRRADLFAVAKIIASYRPDLLTEQERRRLTELPWPLRLGRYLRRHVYRPFIKQKRWRERWARWRRGRFRRPRLRRRRETLAAAAGGQP